MNRKQFGILLVILIVLGGAGWYIHSHGKSEAAAGEQGTGQKLLGDAFPVNDVAQISFKQGTNELVLAKRDETWRVRERDNYPANFSMISEFLLKLRDLKVVQNEPIGASQLSRLELAASGTNSPTVLELKDKDGKTIRSLTLGKKLMRKAGAQDQQFGGFNMADGRYVMLSSDTQHALLIGDPLNSAEPKPTEWLDKEFFKIERPRTIAVDFPTATNSWKIVRDTPTTEWHFAETNHGEQLDAARASGVSEPFSSPSFDDVMPHGPNADAAMQKPTVVTVETTDGFTYAVKIGAKIGEEYPLMMTLAKHPEISKERPVGKDETPDKKKAADEVWNNWKDGLEKKINAAQRCENWVYLVPTWNVDSILKERKDLVAEKKEEPKPAENKPQSSATPAPETGTNALALPDVSK